MYGIWKAAGMYAESNECEMMPDKKWRSYRDRCWKCKVLLDEDTGECPKCHGTLLHGCETKCCSILVGGNHKFCKYHREKHVKSICKLQKEVLREYESRRYGKSAYKYNYLDSKDKKLEFAIWEMKKLGFTDELPQLQLELANIQKVSK